MAKDDFSVAQARLFAQRIRERYGPQIAAVSAAHGIPAEWFAGLTGMETIKDGKGYPYEWPDKRSYRFEPAVYARFKKVLSWSPLNWARWSYNGIKYSHIKGMDDATLRAISTSYGMTQIMGYYVLNILVGTTIKQLRDPSLHYNYTARLMEADPRIVRYIRKARDLSTPTLSWLRYVGHIWNSGREWDGTPKGIKTWTPSYMNNIVLVAQEYRKLLASAPDEAAKMDAPSRRVSEGQKGGEALTLVPLPVGQPSQQAAPSGAANALQLEPFGVPITLHLNRPSERAREEGMNTNSILGQDETEALDNDMADPQTSPSDLPSVGMKPGYKTSEGQLAGLVSIALSVFTFFHWVSPSQADNVQSLIAVLINNIGPLVPVLGIVMAYIKSRGMMKSNSIWATASMNNPLVQNKNLVGGSGLNSILGGIFGGGGIKDPETIAGITRTTGTIVGGKAGKTIDKILGPGSGGAKSQYDDATLDKMFNAIGDRLVGLHDQQAQILDRLEKLATTQVRAASDDPFADD
jgi:hypothetical protein